MSFGFDNNTLTYNLGKLIRMANKYSNVDFYYGPYESIDEAEEYLKYLKSPGLTVLIGNEEDGFDEYWYKDNTDKLVKKVNVIDISKSESSIVFSGYDTDTDGEYSDYVINFIELIYITPYNKSTLTIGDEFPVDDIENTENTENTENIENIE